MDKHLNTFDKGLKRTAADADLCAAETTLENHSKGQKLIVEIRTCIISGAAGFFWVVSHTFK